MGLFTALSSYGSGGCCGDQGRRIDCCFYLRGEWSSITAAECHLMMMKLMSFFAGMYKNQLQELAQRSCFNLPAYACIREGPDHAPRFKATVNFNGEIFESPNYCSTLRQAEHAAAEVALNTLSRRGPSQSLAARILVAHRPQTEREACSFVCSSRVLCPPRTRM